MWKTAREERKGEAKLLLFSFIFIAGVYVCYEVPCPVQGIAI